MRSLKKYIGKIELEDLYLSKKKRHLYILFGINVEGKLETLHGFPLLMRKMSKIPSDGTTNVRSVVGFILRPSLLLLTPYCKGYVIFVNSISYTQSIYT